MSNKRSQFGVMNDVMNNIMNDKNGHNIVGKWLTCLSIVDTGSVENNMKMFVSFDRLRSTSAEDPGANQK